MARMLRRIGIALLALVGLGVAVLVGGSLLSLDWGRAHSARTQQLPLLGDSTGQGLVRIAANGLEFRARVAGLGSGGPGLVLLHGYPVTSAMWEPLLAPAAAAGYRVIAFDQRGYSPGARPEGVEAYRIDRMVEDVVAVADAAGFEDFHLVGHDWGCVVGWIVAVRHPEPSEPEQAIAVVSPCGSCRELIWDYDRRARVIVPGPQGPAVVSISELLPNKYSRERTL